jgi:hypothetical protein
MMVGLLGFFAWHERSQSAAPAATAPAPP